MKGNINRDWTNVDWYAVSSNFDRRVTVSATVNGHQIRAYEFDTSEFSSEAARFMNDLLEAVKQHRSKK